MEFEARPEISVVIPLFNEQESMAELFRRLRSTIDAMGRSAEVICVDDGSEDQTSALCRQQCGSDARVRLVRLSRNFGHQAAISAGLDYASGEAVVIMDGDLQDPPEMISIFVAKWQEGYDVVYAVRRSRREGVLKRTAYWIFYRMLSRVSSVDVPEDSGDFGLLDRRVADLVRRMPERNRFLRGLRSWVGLRQVAVEVDREARVAGSSKYTLAKLMRLAMDGFVSFSHAPLRLATRTGFGVSIVSFLFASWVVVLKLAWGVDIPGWASTIVIVSLLGGIQLITIGILGEYVGRIYDEVKRRPLYIVAETDNLRVSGDGMGSEERARAESVDRRL